MLEVINIGVFALKNWLRHGNRSPDGVTGGDGAAGCQPAVEHLLSSSRPAFATRCITSVVYRSCIVELRRFLDEVGSGKADLPDHGFVATASRLHRTRELADLLERIGV